MLNYKNTSGYNFQNTPDTISFFNTIYPYFELVKGRSVLEIGPFLGEYSNIIVSHDPKSLTMVENNPESIPLLKQKFPEFEIVYDDIFQYLRKDITPVDVVVCCGVLYHFHSPLHLLELIANYANPDFLIVEFPSITDPPPEIFKEGSNGPGNRFTSPGWKYIDKSILITDEHMIESIEQLGYKLTVKLLPVPKQENLSLFKEGMIFSVFEKVKND
jgi:Methyltransferase domain